MELRPYQKENSQQLTDILKKENIISILLDNF